VSETETKFMYSSI